MKKLALLFISLSFIACQNEKKTINGSDNINETDYTSLSFKYDSVKVSSNFVIKSNENTTDTTKAVIRYPVFQDQQINQFIEQKVMNCANEGEHYTTYKDFTNAFVKNFDSFSTENKDYGQTWFMDAKVEVKEQHPQYLSFLLTFVNYEGGAHPNSAYTYLNYDPQNHKEVVLDSLINPGSMPKLTAIAEKVFRKNEKLSPTASLKDNYFFENDKFSLNQNFSITKKGLKFLYNPYEIKAYAYGITELVIPFADLKDIAKPNSLLNPAN
ncbi:MAG: DUF3298 domain-containing protein [Candidatus Pedobacter colombiensis]|uniref:DUF3298 domain-containing protein n=1 Tax=Candidatus Pedobacter colombiensis TaxID=3121371 RepID=A0AAJ6B7E5_9SPHI|nr:DUF3298 and DUF4163 domain-containing protein [Pedobacter sp.]WEK17988.1 MAG: DUF3298 domain-containing protein [Pedobacter sp.]